jgi:hypothetical protein
MICLNGGCDSQAKKPSLTEEMNALKESREQLARQLERSESENDQLKEHIAVLSGFSPDVKVEDFYKLESVKITRYTNFYDKDKDGSREKLIVYLQPTDEDGDVVKAAGAVEVQLWSLGDNAKEALLGEWKVGPEQLRKLWYGTMLTINYRLVFDVDPAIAESRESLTVKVEFTDYLTGRVFTEQRAIKVD